MITLHLKSQQDINRAQRWYILLSAMAVLTFLTSLFQDPVPIQLSALLFIVMIAVLVFSTERCQLSDPITTNQLEQFIKDLSTINDPKLIEQVQQGLASSLIITQKASQQVAELRIEVTEKEQWQSSVQKLKGLAP